MITQKTKQQISEAVSAVLGKLSTEQLPNFTVEVPASVANGDFSCNAALVSAKVLKQPPRKVAELILNEMDTSSFKKVEIAGPGFINFFVEAKWHVDAVREVLALAGDYGKSSLGEGKRVLLEFVSANPTGPMHIGNARGGALGDCLASLLQFAGYYVEREFYVNDAGNQIDKFGLSLDLRYRQELGENVELPEDIYHGEDIVEHAKNFIKEHGDKYLKSTETERRAALVAFALPLNIKTLEEDLGKYRIKYDNWFRESTLHESGEVSKIVELLTEKGQTYEKDGAIWLKTEQFGDEKDRVLVRANGVPTYLVPDIAYHYNKLSQSGRNFDLAVDIFGADHHGYMARMNAAMSALGIEVSRLKMIIMQMVRLKNRAGETIKLSKRSGKAITLSTLLEEVPVDAARFFFNLRDANTHLEFDLDLAIEETSKNPVYYVQYAHARTCNILKRLSEDEGVTLDENYAFSYAHEAEIQLSARIAAFPDEIVSAAESFDPSRLTRYATELAQSFHLFYENCHIKGHDIAVQQSRLALVAATGIVLRNVLGILKVEAPERM